MDGKPGDPGLTSCPRRRDVSAAFGAHRPPPHEDPALLENHTIARIAGIPIRANLLLGYLLALWAILGAAQGRAMVTTQLIVVSTLLLLAHELGHAFVARRLGLEVVDIVLWPLGGMARIREMPENARTEAWVAAAGPLANLALAAVAAPLLLLNDGPPAYVIAGVPISEGLGGLVTLWVLVNLAYAVFNLIPAFPMDGGRLLRAFLARGQRSWVTATDQATSIGGKIAWVAILASLWHGWFFLVLVGFFVLWAGLRERWAVRLRNQASAFDGSGGRMGGWDFLMRQRGGAPGGSFGGPFSGAFGGQGPGPEAPPFAGGDGPILDADVGPTPDQGRPAGPSGGGFSEDDIAKLESFRGRLQKPNREGGE